MICVVCGGAQIFGWRYCTCVVNIVNTEYSYTTTVSAWADMARYRYHSNSNPILKLFLQLGRPQISYACGGDGILFFAYARWLAPGNAHVIVRCIALRARHSPDPAYFMLCHVIIYQQRIHNFCVYPHVRCPEKSKSSQA